MAQQKRRHFRSPLRPPKCMHRPQRRSRSCVELESKRSWERQRSRKSETVDVETGRKSRASLPEETLDWRAEVGARNHQERSVDLERAREPGRGLAH
jgi:hypothetical protein